jgi:hypothetical protein
MSGFVFASCASCAQGCNTLDDPLNGTGSCPKYWQRPDGSNLCSESYSCSASSISIRIVGCFFLIVALVYCRLIYISHIKSTTSAFASAGAELQGSACGRVLNRALSCLRAVDPQTAARLVGPLSTTTPNTIFFHTNVQGNHAFRCHHKRL